LFDDDCFFKVRPRRRSREGQKGLAEKELNLDGLPRRITVWKVQRSAERGGTAAGCGRPWLQMRGLIDSV